MGLRGKKADRQFQYWNLRRKGMGQSEIARKYGVSRQVVSRSISRFENELSRRFLEFSEISAISVNFFDKEIGLLVGNIIPVNGLECLIIVDESNKLKFFYDNSIIKDKNIRYLAINELDSILNKIFSINISGEKTFKQIIDLITSMEGKK